MDARIQELVDFTKIKFGLGNYYLKEYQFYRRVNIFNETIYTLSMEWLPNDIERDEGDLNPEGAASIEINLKNRKFEKVIFVKGKSYAENGVMFNNRENIIKWLENETGLTYGEQFQLKKEEKEEFLFQGCVKGVPLYPPSFIEIHINEDRKLTQYSIYGEFPYKEQIKEEKYSLSLEGLQHLYREQLKLIEYPSFEQKKIYPIYAIEEIFSTNDGKSIIPYEVLFAEKSNLLEINQTICWDEPLNIPFERKRMNWVEDITAEQAFSAKPSPDSFPITEEEQEKCTMAVEKLLRQEYPNETGKWVLIILHREKGYIHAILRAKKQDELVFQRKILVFIDSESFQAVNYMDSKPMLETFDDFQAPDVVTITKEEAYEILKERFELTPYYVYNFKQGQYHLCGKLDCQYGVNASTGEVIALNEL